MAIEGVVQVAAIAIKDVAIRMTVGGAVIVAVVVGPSRENGS